MPLKGNLDFDIDSMMRKTAGKKESVMFAHLENGKFTGFADTLPGAQVYANVSQGGKAEKVLVVEDARGNYWGLWNGERFVLVADSQFGLKLAMGKFGEIDEIQEEGVRTRVSVSPIKNMAENMDQPGANLVNMNRIFERIEEIRPNDLRRLVSKCLLSGDFDDDHDLKKEVEILNDRLSKNKLKHKPKKPSMNDYVSRPVSDSPGEQEGGEGAV